MTKDKEIEELFSSAITEFDDNEKFIADLSNQMDKLEYVRNMQAEQKRHYRFGLVAAFVAGVVGVVVALIVFPLLPYDVQIIDRLARSGNALALSSHAKMIATLLFAILTSAVIYSILSIVRDLRRLASRGK